MKIKKIKKAMEAEIRDYIAGSIAKFAEETEVNVKSINVDFGTSHSIGGDVEYHLSQVKTKLDI